MWVKGGKVPAFTCHQGQDSAVVEYKGYWFRHPGVCHDRLRQVRRVEAQGEMLKLLPLHANKVYDCAVKLFPSLDGEDITER